MIIGAVGVKLLYPDDTVQHGGVILGLGDSAAHAFSGAPYDSYGMYGRLLVPYNYSAVTAACMMVSKKKFLSVKGFDENLKVAFNDVDFCLKLLDKKYQQLLNEIDYLNSKWNYLIHHDPFYNKNFSLKKSFVLDKKKRDVKDDEENS